MTAIGKARRMARLFRKSSGRMLCLPMDHGMMIGPAHGIADPGPVLDAMDSAGVEAVIVGPGLLARHHKRFEGGPAIILRLDQTTMWRTGTPTGYADVQTRQVVSVEEAVQMGAEAVITYLFTCNNDPVQETACFTICADVARDCRRFGLVHVIEAMAAKGGFAAADDPEIVSLNCRMAGELGADILKTDWCGPAGFAKVAAQSLAPVAVAGGASGSDDAALAAFAHQAIASGASGLMFGRNVFQRDDMAGTLRTLSSIVHG
ncbi:class I fructose-bisphosphate aldolase [Tabrizicola sp.]|uniref:class I fructose-bisphosphate aldolase n=1 Tax=Tabrizicola sp. TaxID=2005166 RepID=UPI002FDCFC91